MSRAPKQDPLKPRKTGIQSRATKTVEAIVEAAARILEKHGFEGYTTNAVAERAGVSIGTLYQYFPNKDAITIALITRESATLRQEVEEAAACANWKTALDLMVGAAVRHQLRRPALSRLLDIEEARLPASDETMPGSGAIHAAVRDVISRAGSHSPSQIEQRTADVMGITRGMTDMAGKMGEPGGADLEGRIRRAVFGYLSGEHA